MEPRNTTMAQVQRAKEGDMEAFREIYEEYIGYVFLFVRSRVSTREDALDITQDTFIDFWKGLKKFQFEENTSKLRNFLLTIASRKISRFYRFRKKTVSFEDLENVLHEENYAQVIDSIMVESLLKRLTSKDREVIELRYFAGMPFTQIAEALGKSESAIKVRHHRAIQKLQEYY